MRLVLVGPGRNIRNATGGGLSGLPLGVLLRRGGACPSFESALRSTAAP